MKKDNVVFAIFVTLFFALFFLMVTASISYAELYPDGDVEAKLVSIRSGW